ncbi:MAG TPA: MarR family transcriptional regulator [Gemmatimonadaceae bacterium]|jgi:DNA-binding MarR family transcriptional regulator|nr:MarR family transcriptional regulator [Gemmatimonadaceae bacterium]
MTTRVLTLPASPVADQRAIADIMDGVRSVVRALRINTRAIEKQLGISLAQLWVLQILAERPAESLNELAVATATHQSSVSVVVRRLVDRALVTRTTAHRDKRRVRIELTDAGRTLLGQAPPTVQGSLVEGLRRMSLDGRLELAALMREWLSLSGMDLNAAPPMLLEDDL